MLQKIITYSFYLLFILTPLIWYPYNSELFEFNKMMFVYLLTIIITAAWLIKMITAHRLFFKRTPLDIPLLLFLLANVFSTIFSIDLHTSIWGYYSRSNGGLLSLTSYLLLYWALVSNFNSAQAFKFLKASLIGGLFVSLWAIPEHFGVSPSCVLLRGNFDAVCWVQNVQARVFATLGQPNWLAAYLSMLIFPAIYFAVSATSKLTKTSWVILVGLLYLAFTFTYSRGGTLGTLLGLGLFIGVIFFNIFKKSKLRLGSSWKLLLGIFGSLIIISLLFGTALTDFKLITPYAPPPRPGLVVGGSSQLESGGNETGKIRLIVWRGALEIFKAYPIFGSGVETFAYSYYSFRPAAHNLTSEWDFLYNKAHNEFLNYLATTGIVGFSAYMLVILVFIGWSAKNLYQSLSVHTKNSIQSASSHNTYYLILTVLAAYISYLVQNFFSFSVVIIALLFYLYPALIFTAADSTHTLKLPLRFSFINRFINKIVFRQPRITQLFIIMICVVAVYLIISLYRFHQADIDYAAAQAADDGGNAGQAYNLTTDAISLNYFEPLYHSDLSFYSAEAAIALVKEDPTRSGQLSAQANDQAQMAVMMSPSNLSIRRTAIRTYYLLSELDPGYSQITLDNLNQAIALAPTDVKLIYNKALIEGYLNQTDQSLETFRQVISLKSDYKEATLSYGQSLVKINKLDQAKQVYQKYLQLVPNDEDISKELQKITAS